MEKIKFVREEDDEKKPEDVVQGMNNIEMSFRSDKSRKVDDNDIIELLEDIDNYRDNFIHIDSNSLNNDSQFTPEDIIYGEVPLFTIYFKEKNGQIIEQISLIRNFLVSEVNIEKNDIVDVDISNDFELSGYLSAHCGDNLVFPIVMLKQTIIGGLNELEDINISGKLKELLSLYKSGETKIVEEMPQLGIFSKAIESVEHLVSNLNPLNFFRKKENDISNMEVFEVINTNWYHRSLSRKFFFGEKVLMRVNPFNNNVRAVHPYSDIKSVTRYDKNNIVITYKTGASSDSIKTSAKDIERMIEILKSNNTGYPIIIQGHTV